MNCKIAVINGDGIGPEIVKEGTKVLDAIAKRFVHRFTYERGYVGGESYENFGTPLSEATMKKCKASEAVLLGTVGGPKWNSLEEHLRPEIGFLSIVEALELDEIVTENIFGEILSCKDVSITESTMMSSSKSLGNKKKGVYKPSHGPAQDIAGKNIANPIAVILSAAMMLKYTFNLTDEAETIEKAVKEVLEEGYRTLDIYTEGTVKVSTSKMGDLIANKIKI